MFKSVLVATLLACSSALAPTQAKRTVSAPKISAPKPVSFAAAAAAFTPFAALAGGQSEGTGLVLGIDDGRETTVLTLVFGSFFWLYYNWAKDQPDSDSDFFAEYDERRGPGPPSGGGASGAGLPHAARTGSSPGMSWKDGVDLAMESSSSFMSAGMSAKSGVLR